MRIRGYLLPALALCFWFQAGQAAPAPQAASTVDPGVLADTLNSPIPVEPGEAAAPYPGAKPQAGTKLSRAEARAALRREKAAERQRLLAGSYERRLAQNAVRDSSRRRDNLLLGGGFSLQHLAFSMFDDTSDTETAPSLGILIGYRNHSSRKLGVKTSLYYHTGITTVDRDYPYKPGNYGYNHAYGSKGTTSGFEAVGQAVLGPFGRFAFEPGIAYGMGWHSAKAIGLSGDDGADTYYPKPRFTTLAAVGGVSLYLGRYDQINPTGWISLGKALGVDDGLMFQVNVAFVMAFREE